MEEGEKREGGCPPQTEGGSCSYSQRRKGGKGTYSTMEGRRGGKSGGKRSRRLRKGGGPFFKGKKKEGYGKGSTPGAP